MSRIGLKFCTKGAIVYDTSIGNGVDANGFASLPLRAGGTRYFVGSGGSDANTGLSHAQRLATLSAAVTKVTGGAGDQILIAEGTNLTAGLSNMTGKDGFSLIYPTVIQSYDPADSTNETKYGRGDQRSARPQINTGATATQFVTSGGGTTANYLAFKGLDFNPGNQPGMNIALLANTTGGGDGVLFENCIFRYTMINANRDAATTSPQRFIMRNCASYGQHGDPAITGYAQGVFFGGWQSWTIEDCVFYHCGWKIGVARNATSAAYGSIVFNHPVYAHDETNGGIFRRNLSMEGSNDGGSFRGSINCNHNVFLNNPTHAVVGGGSEYDVRQPSGVTVDCSYNTCLGDAVVGDGSGSSTVVAWGIDTANGKSGTAIHHNLVARADNTGVGYAMLTEANFNQPSYADFHNNVSHLWNNSGHTKFEGGTYAPAQIHTSYSNNVWDDPTSGSNTNSGSVSFPNAYTKSGLYTALGYADEAAFIADVIARPEGHIQRTANSLLLAGYGIS